MVEDNLLKCLKKIIALCSEARTSGYRTVYRCSELTTKNIGKTLATAYDTTHGFFDQYIVEIDVFHKICQEAGLSDEKEFREFLYSDTATVSINLLK